MQFREAKRGRSSRLTTSQDYLISVTGDADIARQTQRASLRIAVLVVLVTLAGCSGLQQFGEPAPITKADVPSDAPVVVLPPPPVEPQLERSRIITLVRHTSASG